MKKVLRHGHSCTVITCPFCECRFFFDKDEIQTMAGVNSRWDWVECPECGYENQLAPSTYMEERDDYNVNLN